MQCPKLSELPPPPEGKTGWPWTEETPPPPPMVKMSYARITIVTPSYNTIAYLEETIRSVLLQGYPELEYIIIDGGSTDGSLEVIRKYAPWLAHWISEKDRGYADAVNKGFRLATGEIRAWLPASDNYMPSALFAAERYLGKNQADFAFGRKIGIDENGIIQGFKPDISKNLRHLTLYGRRNPCQPATFWCREIHQKTGELNESLRLAADSEWFLRLGLTATCRWIPEPICQIRDHPNQLSESLTSMRAEWLNAWAKVVRSRGISRFRILTGMLVFVPLIRYCEGGWRAVFRVPGLGEKSMLFRRFKKPRP